MAGSASDGGSKKPLAGLDERFGGELVDRWLSAIEACTNGGLAEIYDCCGRSYLSRRRIAGPAAFCLFPPSEAIATLYLPLS